MVGPPWAVPGEGCITRPGKSWAGLSLALLSDCTGFWTGVFFKVDKITTLSLWAPQPPEGYLGEWLSVVLDTASFPVSPPGVTPQGSGGTWSVWGKENWTTCDSANSEISWDISLVINAIWLVILMHTLTFPLFFPRFTSVNFPSLSGPTPPLMPILCCRQTHRTPPPNTHKHSHKYTHFPWPIFCISVVFLFSSEENGNQTENYPYLLIPTLKKKKVSKCSEKKARNYCLWQKRQFCGKKMSVLPDASGLGCLIHLLSQQLQALCQTPHLLPCAVSISWNPIGACCRH